jgi:alginate O-acetyltransferase complex protein AlgJ
MNATVSAPRPAREEQALREVGRTAVSRPVAAGLAALVLATSFGVLAAERGGIARAGGAGLWPAPAELGRRLAAGFDAEGFVGGNRALLAEIAGVESRLEEGSILVERVVPWAQWAETAFLGDGNRRVYVGRSSPEGGAGERWLFFRPDVGYLTGRPFLDPRVLAARRAGSDSWEEPLRPDPRPAVAGFARQLGERGIALVVVPTPVKPMIHPERLAGPRAGAEPPLQNRSFELLVRDLEAAGVTVFDPAPVLARALRETGEPQYLAHDTHWTPAAMDRVARSLAEHLAAVLGPGPLAGSATGAAEGPPPAAHSRQPVRVRGTGDLARMLRLEATAGVLPELFPPQEVTVQQVLDPFGSFVRPDREAEVLLLGDSFTNVLSQPELGWGQGAGLAEQLAYHLGRPVDRIAVNAGGSHTSRERLAQVLASDAGRLDGKRVVVYQFAVRELAEGDWRLVELPAPPGGGDG